MKRVVITALMFTATAVFSESFTMSESVKTSRSEPIYKNVVTERPIKECWDESVERRSSYSGSNDVVGGIVGGAIGGVLGNQVGRGSGKTAATIGGAILGSMAGQSASSSESRPERETIRKCKTRYESESRQVLTGYNNYGVYRGKEIVKFSETPMSYINVYISVSY